MNLEFHCVCHFKKRKTLLVVVVPAGRQMMERMRGRKIMSFGPAWATSFYFFASGPRAKDESADTHNPKQQQTPQNLKQIATIM